MQTTTTTTVTALASALLAAAALIPATAAEPPGEAAVDPRIAASADDGEPTDVWVLMDERADLSGAATIDDWTVRGAYVVDRLRDTAASSQREVAGWLRSAGVDFEAYWAVNAVLVHDAAPQVVDRLAGTAGVSELRATTTVSVPPVTPSGPGETAAAARAAAAVEWGVAATRAPEVWDTFGTRGETIVVGSVDSGADAGHPALAAQYRGRQAGGGPVHDHNWFDPSGACGAAGAPPCDNTGHGTHTIGTMIGDDGAGNGIGVAPGAQWIAAKGCENTSCSDASLIAAGQWMLAPTAADGTDARPELRPHVVNNSWGSPTASGFYRDVVDAWVAAGMVPVFSAGNDGPACSTHGEPGSLPQAYAVGAFDEAGAIAPFSSRGPSPLDGGGKPDIAAPGVAVRSAQPGGGYWYADGTSMATPHVAGAVALLLSAAPRLIGDVDAVRELLDASAVDTDDPQCGGTAADNNVWGEGRLDVFAAVERAPRGPLGAVAGTVTGADGAPLAGAEVRLDGGPRSLRAATGADGRYTLTRVPVGAYTYAVSSFGYRTVRGAVTVTADQIAVVPAVLEPAPRHDVVGTVVDDAGRPVAAARVVVEGSPLPAAGTDAEGRFALPALPEGDYVLQITPNACLAPAVADLTVDGPEEVPVTVRTRRDDYGHGCTVGPAEWVDTDTPLGVTGTQGARWVELPFAFPFYGASYDRVVVAANGLLSFAGVQGTWDPSDLYGAPFPIPFAHVPDAAIYPFWDDLVIDDRAGVYARTVGTAPDRTYVIEWRDVLVGNDGVERRASLQALLHEDGRVTVQYRGLDNARERGSGAAVGIESPGGTDGLQFSYRAPTLPDDGAVEFGLGAHGTVRGVVTDGNDGTPVAGARVEASAGAVTRTTTTGADGSYWVQLPPGAATVRIAASGYEGSTASAHLADGDAATVDAALATGAAAVSATELVADVTAGGELSEQVTITNTGAAPLSWSVAESGGDRVGSSGEPGEVLRSWLTSGLTQAPHGIGLAGDTVWVSETRGSTARALEYGRTGAPTGRSVDYHWLPQTWYRWALGDMAYDAGRRLMCQAVAQAGPDDGIHCWRPDTGERAGFIPSSGPEHDWADFYPTGLAYRPETDTFFVSDPRRVQILEVAGLSHPVPGAVVHSCLHDEYPHGLAWDATTGTLWLANRTLTDSIVGWDPASCTVTERIDHPAQVYQGAGLDLDASGNLWTVGNVDGRVYQLTSGSPLFADVPWLTVAGAPSADAVLAPGEAATLTVTAGAAGLEPGRHEAEVWLRTDAGRQPRVRIPVRLTLTDYDVAVEVGGPAYTSPSGPTWAADRPWTAGGWGWTGTSSARTVKRPIAGTDDGRLYASARTGGFGYRFSGLPDGRYEVELGFAEIQRRAGGSRVFDVLAEGRRIAYALDPAREYGQDTAGRMLAVVEMTDGELDLTFVPRAGEPILNALRVTRVVTEE